MSVKMDLTSCKSILQQLYMVRDDLRKSMTTLRQHTERLVGLNWIGASPNEFLREYTRLEGELKGYVDGIDGLSDKLEKAIEIFQSVDSSFG